MTVFLVFFGFLLGVGVDFKTAPILACDILCRHAKNDNVPDGLDDTHGGFLEKIVFYVNLCVYVVEFSNHPKPLEKSAGSLGAVYCGAELERENEIVVDVDFGFEDFKDPILDCDNVVEKDIRRIGGYFQDYSTGSGYFYSFMDIVLDNKQFFSCDERSQLVG